MFVINGLDGARPRSSLKRRSIYEYVVRTTLRIGLGTERNNASD